MVRKTTNINQKTQGESVKVCKIDVEKKTSQQLEFLDTKRFEYEIEE
jgi:hypothetical protein